MKVLQVLNHFLPNQTAGTEIYVWALSKHLKQLNIDCSVVIPNYLSSTDNVYDFDNLQVLSYAEPSIVTKQLQMGFTKPLGLVNFELLIESEKPDIIHFHELAGSSGIGLHHLDIAKKTGAKIVMTFHLPGYTCKSDTLLYNGLKQCDGLIENKRCSTCYLNTKKGTKLTTPFLVTISSIFNYFNINPYKWKNAVGTAFSTVQQISQLKENFNYLVDKCDKIVVLTDWYKNVLILNGVPQEKLIHISQGLINDGYPFQKKERLKTNSILRLIFIGRIVNFKGLHLLLKAIAELDDYKIELDIYGQSNNDQYEIDCKNSCVNNNLVSFKGPILHARVVETIMQYDLLCLCSTFSEMSPLVIQEAFQASIPVLASNVKGNSEQIQHNINGLLFNFNDTNSLKQQLLRCINEPNLLGNLKKNIVKPNKFSNVSQAYFQLYKTLFN
ncbi:MAG: glycosyltransferase [Bacteroidetes bacterium]|nr:glycosyltransferase [Bacteroidota bacterium]